MCEYCENMKNSDNEPTVHLGEIKIGEIGTRDLIINLDLDCYANMENGIYKISAWLDTQRGDDLVTSVKIHYCPFCGRKLD